MTDNDQGSITERTPGRYTARAFLGRQPARRCASCNGWQWTDQYPTATRCRRCDGPLGPKVQRLAKVTKTFGDRGKAERWKHSLEEEADAKRTLKQPVFDPMPVEEAGETCAEMFDRYLAHREAQAPAPHGKRPTPATLRRYRQLLRDHAGPVVGRRLVTDLTAADVQDVISTMGDGGQSPRSQLACRNLLHHVFRWAKLQPNPAQYVDLPKIVEVRRHRTPTLDEVRKLLALSAETEFGLALRFTAQTGWRRDEVVGLQWRDIKVDGDAVLVTCRRSVVKGERAGEYDVGLTKDKRQRPVPVDGVLAAQLREQLAARAAELSAGGVLPGPGFEDVGFVFGHGDQPLDPDRLRRYFEKLTKRAGIEDVTYHGLRKAASSISQGNGVAPAEAQALLGHASYQTTARHYTTAYDDGLARAAATMAKLLD